MNPIAYLTCELKARDLDSRLLVAAHLLDRGVACVVGQQWAIWDSVATLPPGCLVMTSASLIQAGNAQQFKQRGHRVVMSDEEALALVSPRHLMANVTPEAFDAADVFLAQSERHQEIVRDCFPGAANKSDPLGQRNPKVVLTGNPRCDLLTEQGRLAFRQEASELCGGEPFILFNSNFALEHFVWGDVNDITKERAEQFGIRLDMLEWERTNKRMFIELIDWCVAHLPKHQVVIRPHPAERRGSWAEVAQRSARIKVVEGSMPVPWLIAADVVVHTNCTTGLEAAMLGVPCINLSPDADAEWHGAFITRSVNRTVASVAEASAMIDEYLLAPPIELAAHAHAEMVIEKHLPHWQSGMAFANVAHRIYDQLGQMGEPPQSHAFALDIRLTPQGGTPEKRTKFQVTREEVERRLLSIAHAFGIGNELTVKTRQLDESVVLMVRE